MSNSQKGFAPILVLILLLVIVLVGAGIYNLNKTKSPNPKESTNVVAYPSVVTSTIDPSIKINYDLREIPLEQDLREAGYTKIPDTDLELKIPKSYKLRKNGMTFGTKHLFTARTDIKQHQRDFRICQGDSMGHTYLNRPDYADWIEPYLTEAYCRAFLTTNSKVPEDTFPNRGFNIIKVVTNSSENDWMLDNYHPQGENYREHPEWVLKAQQVTINNNIFYAYTVGCCGASDPIYIYPYNYQGTKLLLVFINENAPVGKIPDPFLDSILATLRKTN